MSERPRYHVDQNVPGWAHLVAAAIVGALLLASIAFNRAHGQELAAARPTFCPPAPAATAQPITPPVVLMFWAPWCKPCCSAEQQAAVNAAKAAGVRFKFLNWDDAASQAVFQQYAAHTIPMFVGLGDAAPMILNGPQTAATLQQLWHSLQPVAPAPATDTPLAPVASSPTMPSQPTAPPTVAGQPVASVCRITSAEGDSNSIGSGVLVRTDSDGNGLVLTAEHVLRDNTGQPIIVKFASGQSYKGVLLAKDRGTDLAAVVIARAPSEPATLGKPALTGQAVTCRGWGSGTYGETAGTVTGFGSATAGGVAAWMTIGKPIRNGDSGCGVFDADGHVVGIAWGGAANETQASTVDQLQRFAARWLTGSTIMPPTKPLNAPLPPTVEPGTEVSADDAANLVKTTPREQMQPPSDPVALRDKIKADAEALAARVHDHAATVGGVVARAEPVIEAAKPWLDPALKALLVSFGVPTGGASLGLLAGWAAIKGIKAIGSRLGSKTGGAPATPAITFPTGPGTTVFAKEFGQQLLEQYSREGRDPVLDCTRGVIYDTEIEQRILSSTPAVAQVLKDLRQEVESRFYKIHPPTVATNAATLG